ncbi:hypothetical protein BGW80DRAFT_507067 [Lactifluus volemus]|nr:hypothetical protein BGW80DRAFT_507067 [Lactifluus volemus]
MRYNLKGLCSRYDSQKESTDVSRILSLHSMTHQEFLVILRLVLKDCVEGLQALTGSITKVIEGIRLVYQRHILLIYKLQPLDHQRFHPSSWQYMILYSTPFPPLRNPQTFQHHESFLHEQTNTSSQIYASLSSCLMNAGTLWSAVSVRPSAGE